MQISNITMNVAELVDWHDSVSRGNFNISKEQIHISNLTTMLIEMILWYVANEELRKLMITINVYRDIYVR